MTGIFQNKVALVTGAGSGLGRVSALALAREGAKVVVVDVDTENGQQTVEIIKKAGGEAVFIKTDISKAAEVEAMITKTVKTYGRLDYAHNNAAIGEPPGPFTNNTEELWDRVMDVNLKGVWLCMRYEIIQMSRQGTGAIVNTASGAGLSGAPYLSIYSASKHGVVGLTKSAALEYAKEGIRVNVVCPGGMEGTGMFDSLPEDVKTGIPFPMGRPANPSEVAAAVVWLCSDAASYITGVALPVDGGMLAGD